MNGLFLGTSGPCGRARSPSAPIGPQPSHNKKTRDVHPTRNPARSASAPYQNGNRHDLTC